MPVSLLLNRQVRVGGVESAYVEVSEFRRAYVLQSHPCRRWRRWSPYLSRSGFKNLIKELDFDEFINKIEKDAVKGETSTH